jgi:hypothetical protein
MCTSQETLEGKTLPGGPQLKVILFPQPHPHPGTFSNVREGAEGHLSCQFLFFFGILFYFVFHLYIFGAAKLWVFF